MLPSISFSIPQAARATTQNFSNRASELHAPELLKPLTHDMFFRGNPQTQAKKERNRLSQQQVRQRQADLIESLERGCAEKNIDTLTLKGLAENKALVFDDPQSMERLNNSATHKTEQSRQSEATKRYRIKLYIALMKAALGTGPPVDLAIQKKGLPPKVHVSQIASDDAMDIDVSDSEEKSEALGAKLSKMNVDELMKLCLQKNIDTRALKSIVDLTLQTSDRRITKERRENVWVDTLRNALIAEGPKERARKQTISQLKARASVLGLDVVSLERKAEDKNKISLDRSDNYRDKLLIRYLTDAIAAEEDAEGEEDDNDAPLFSPGVMHTSPVIPQGVWGLNTGFKAGHRRGPSYQSTVEEDNDPEVVGSQPHSDEPSTSSLAAYYQNFAQHFKQITGQDPITDLGWRPPKNKAEVLASLSALPNSSELLKMLADFDG